MNYRCNYGGILQCLALQKTLENMGHTVEVIRFQALDKGSIKRKIKLLSSGLPLRILVNYLYDIIIDIISILCGKQKKVSQQLLDKCENFIRSNINYTEICNEKTIGYLLIKHQIDTIVIGSDKIWGELARQQLVYMGDFKPNFQGKLLSYAACSSFPIIPSYNKEKIHNLLLKFSAISVRDNYTYNLFRCFPDINIDIVLDPTFLYDFKPYLRKKEEEPYILTYILGREIKGGHKKIIEHIKYKYGNIKIKAIVLANESMDIIPYVDEVIDDADPLEWLNAIYNASFIYTDSFHGVVFSMKFQKPFIAYYREISRASRLIDLRDRFCLDYVIISSVEEMMNKKSIELEIDYISINQIINKQTNISLNFLNNTI